jgi:hypothetical protein
MLYLYIEAIITGTLYCILIEPNVNPKEFNKEFADFPKKELY